MSKRHLARPKCRHHATLRSRGSDPWLGLIPRYGDTRPSCPRPSQRQGFDGSGQSRLAQIDAERVGFPPTSDSLQRGASYDHQPCLKLRVHSPAATLFEKPHVHPCAPTQIDCPKRVIGRDATTWLVDNLLRAARGLQRSATCACKVTVNVAA